MDKIWDRKSFESEVIGRCGGDEKTRMTTQNRQSRTLKKTKKEGKKAIHCYMYTVHCKVIVL